MATRKSTRSESELVETKPAPASTGYTVLARRYRSRDFDEIIGQEAIVRTLKNAVETDRLAHAYLFCGTRGVGKTSIARIFAKAMNLRVAPGEKPLAEADRIAEAILKGEDLDVIEIDGASNRGINEARDLIASAGLSPARCRFRIYIIDEVHQVTKDAFNALLKTMEEPPPHVKFILCTTEVHKVPITIQSRCQRFDFRPLSTPQIAGQLTTILKQEGIKADAQVVNHLARLGNGSMRDALSILDRLLAVGERTLTPELIEQTLGLPDHRLVTNIVDSLIAADPGRALAAGAELLNTGVPVEQALEFLAEHFRNLMVIAACGSESELIDLSTDAREAAIVQAAEFDAPAFVHMIAICDSVARSARSSAAARALFDAALVRLSMSEQLASIPALLARAGQAPAAAATAEKKKPSPLTPPQPVAAAEPVRSTPAVYAEPKPSAARLESPRPVAPTASRASVEMEQSPAAVQARPASAIHAPSDSGAPQSADDLWTRVRRAVPAMSPHDQAKLEFLHPIGFDGTTLRLALDESGAHMASFLRNQHQSVNDLIRRTLNMPIRVVIDDTAAAASPAALAPEAARDEAARIPIVKKAIELFDAAIIAVQPATTPSNADPQDTSDV